jgi:hypothetical protein
MSQLEFWDFSKLYKKKGLHASNKNPPSHAEFPFENQANFSSKRVPFVLCFFKLKITKKFSG